MVQAHYTLLESLERELVSPNARKDRARMDQLLADDFEEYGSSGKVFRKSDILDTPFASASCNLSNFTFCDLAQGVTLVKYMSANSGRTAMRSSIWVKNGGTWQLLHHQGTVVPNAT
jgi:hypothetical protein